jgi:hypothetical protein
VRADTKRGLSRASEIFAGFASKSGAHRPRPF